MAKRLKYWENIFPGTFGNTAFDQSRIKENSKQNGMSPRGEIAGSITYK